jgi:DNA topoisomerase-2
MSEEQLEYKQLSQLQHVKLRPNTYIGSISPQELDMYVLEEKSAIFVQQKVRFSPGLLKIIDEILVNAIDHYTRNPKKVKTIEITFNINKGSISVKNDGGLPIKLVDTLNNGKKYQPEAIFSQFLSGSNFSSEDRIVGGQNGIGAKAANAFSDIFRIETLSDGKLYKQTFRNRLELIEEPIITASDASSTDDFTKISFRPAYAALGYPNGYDIVVGTELYKIIEARAYQVAAFVDCEVIFNKKKIEINNFKQFVDLFATEGEVYRTILTDPENKLLNLEVCIGVSDGKFRQVSLLNGINVFMGGNHIKFLQNEIVENLRKQVEKELSKTKNKFNPNFIINNLFLFVKGHVINPEFNSQSKEKLTTPIEKFQGYKFKAKEWKPIWELLEYHIMSTILGKIKDKKQKRVMRGKVILDKGEDAKFAGDKKKAVDCSLLICEGDSALGLVTRGINHKGTELDKDYYGTFSIQGVPPNCRKMSKKVINKKDGTVHCIRNEKLKNNKRFCELVKICGLDYEKSYDAKTEDGRAEFKTLRYGRIVVAVDQDEDGKGQIFGLLVNFFAYFWPNLSEWGFIKRFNTPIIRAYPKKETAVMEFYTLHAFREWVRLSFAGDEKKVSKIYRIKYYKGLASHDTHEIRPLFNNFENRILTYELDAEAEENLEAYFGEETANRKIALSTPVSPDDEIKEETTISITKLMRTDVKEYQRDNIMRKLPHMMDGMVPARRKAFYAAREIFKTPGAEEIKVFSFTGSAAKMTNYHHGNDSLSNTIIKMAQCFVGARNLPLLIGVGQFGSRLLGGKDHGSPRYVSVKLNQKLTDALYPRCDDFLLRYQFDEGKRCEPSYYVPIIPTAILENMCIPATGWKAEIWARDYKVVIKNVRAMISGEISKCKKLRIWMRGNNSDIRYGSDGCTYLVGKYTFDEKTNVLTVTELPPCVYNKDYIKSTAFNGENTLKPEFKDVYDHSNYDEDTNIDEVDIRFELSPGVMETWLSKEEIEGSICNSVEKAMKLCIKLSSHINMIRPDNTIKEYKLYSTIVNEWFIERKKLYKERMDRMVILTKLQIKYLENIIRFTQEQDDYGISNKTPEVKFIEILHENKYDMFNKSLLFNPEYTPIEELEKNIFNGADSSYEYIITLTYRQLLEEACEKRKKELLGLQQKFRDVLADCVEGGAQFTGQKSWLNEIDILEKIIDHGTEKGWTYRKNKHKFMQ